MSTRTKRKELKIKITKMKRNLTMICPIVFSFLMELFQVIITLDLKESRIVEVNTCVMKMSFRISLILFALLKLLDNWRHLFINAKNRWEN
jgi:hypothetical protein